MNDKMRITIEIPNTGLEENILRKGEWEDDSLFGISLRNALMQFTKESVCFNCVLDKLRAEIEQITSRYSISRERGGMGQVEWSDNLIKESEVLKILDKYKAEIERQESEDKE